MNVKELRAALTAAGLPATGRKAELQARLDAHVAEQAAAAAAAAAAAPADPAAERVFTAAERMPSSIARFFDSADADLRRISDATADVTVRVGGAHGPSRLHHSVVLAASCPYLAGRLTTGGFLESDEEVLALDPDVSADVMTKLLRYLYTGSVVVGGADAWELLQVKLVTRIRTRRGRVVVARRVQRQRWP